MIAVDDRGFTLGDGLFETLLSKAGELVLFEAHLARLVRSCEALGLPAPAPDACRSAAREALDRAGLAGARAAVRLSWTAGVGGRGLERPAVLAPSLVARAAPSPPVVAPARLQTVSVRRNEGSPASQLKTLAYLDNVLARREAVAAGADEALMLNNHDELACAAAANLVWTRGEAVFTPLAACGALAGVMLGALEDRLRAEGRLLQRVRAGARALREADAVFLSNSLIGLRPVAWLDGEALRCDSALAELTAVLS